MNNSTAELIRKHEGLRLNAYLCPAGVPTIGYGNTRHPDGSPVKLGETISEEKAEIMLDNTIKQVRAQINKLVKVPLNTNQAAALISFVFNLGAGALQVSTLLSKLNRGDYAGAATEFPRWNKARVNGKLTVLNGLTKRRKEEQTLFNTPA